MEFNYDKDTWNIIDNYFKMNPYYLTKHHLDSYNDFILNKIPLTVSQYNPQKLYKEIIKEGVEPPEGNKGLFKYETEIYYGGLDGSKIYIGRPILYKNIEGEDSKKKALYPNEARLRNITYSSYLFCDIFIRYPGES